MAGAGTRRGHHRRRTPGLRVVPGRAAVHASVAAGGRGGMTSLAYQYVVLRCVPRVEREEFVNVGVVLYCQASDYLDVRWSVDRDRLRALDPALDLDQVCEALSFVAGVCAGDERGGAAAEQPIGTRFGFLMAPRS